MATLVTDPRLEAEILAHRAATGADRFDEVWEGQYMAAAAPNFDHQQIVARCTALLQEVIGWESAAAVLPGFNLSDRKQGWTENYRIPDVAMFLDATAAENHGTHWTGSPDFLIEVTSPGEVAAEKLPFYEKIGARELLIVDRDPWQLELYRLQEGKLTCVGKSSLADAAVLASAVLPISLQLFAGPKRPQIAVRRTDGATGRWFV